MEWEDYKKFIVWKDTIVRCDITPLFENPKVFHNLVEDMIRPFRKKSIDKVIALDALGFVLGSAVAYKLKKPLVLVRKGGKFPLKKSKLIWRDFVDYTKTKKRLEIKKSSINNGERVLIIDEWIDTGTQIENVIKLVEKLKGKIVGISSINMKPSKKTKTLMNKYYIHTLRVQPEKK